MSRSGFVIALKPQHEFRGCMSTMAPQGGLFCLWPMRSLPHQVYRLQKL